MTRSRDRVLVSALRLLVAGLLVVVLVRAVNFGDAVNVLKKINPLALVPVLGLFGIGQVLSCFRWRLALSQIVERPPALLELFRLYLIGMFVNLGLPTTAGGDVVRAEFAYRLVGNRATAYASIFADRLIGVVAVVLVAAIAMIFAAGFAGAETKPLVLSALIALSILLAVIFLALRWPGSVTRWPKLAGFAGALRLLARRPAVLAACLAMAVIVQAVAVVVPIAILASSMAIDVPLAVHFILVPIIVLATIIPLAPNGLGVRETGFILLYGQFGVDADAAFALGLAWSLVLTAFGLAGGIAMVARSARA